MKKDIDSKDTISEGTLHEILLDIKYRLDHIEDIGADNRDFIVKLIKQGNQIVKFLKNLEIEELPADDYESISIVPRSEEDVESEKKFSKLKELLDEYLNRDKDLKELEKELKKNKDQLTPGQIGET